jgi:acyl-coenzyme A synthetase/AMP-(fatty) acid ligase
MELNLFCLDKDGKEIKGAGEGRLCIAQSWPGQMRTVYGDHQRFIDTYFSQFEGNILPVMAVEEMKMATIGLQEEWMM